MKTIKMAMSTYLSIITLDVNGLSAPFKRHRVAEWIIKKDPYIYSQVRLTSDQKKRQPESKRGRKDIS